MTSLCRFCGTEIATESPEHDLECPERLAALLRAEGEDVEAIEGGVIIARSGEARVIPIPEQFRP